MHDLIPDYIEDNYDAMDSHVDYLTGAKQDVAFFLP
jgi:hypothetical protein